MDDDIQPRPTVAAAGAEEVVIAEATHRVHKSVDRCQESRPSGGVVNVQLGHTEMLTLAGGAVRPGDRLDLAQVPQKVR